VEDHHLGAGEAPRVDQMLSQNKVQCKLEIIKLIFHAPSCASVVANAEKIVGSQDQNETSSVI